MKGLGHYCVDLLDRLAAFGPLYIAETGTMFKTQLEPGEIDLSARSTVAITQWKIGQRILSPFFSIDADASHLGTCHAALTRLGLVDFVTFVHGKGADSLDRLRFGPWNFVLLDSDSDANVILGEYLQVKDRMSPNGIILIDDAFKHPLVNKFAAVKEHLKGPWYPIGGIAAAIPFGPEAARICIEVGLL